MREGGRVAPGDTIGARYRGRCAAAYKKYERVEKKGPFAGDFATFCMGWVSKGLVVSWL